MTVKTIFAGSFKPPHKGHYHIVKKMLSMDKEGMVYVFISKKEREPCMKLTGEISKEIWEEFLKLLPKKDRERVKLILSKMPSPTQTAYGFVKSIAKKGDFFYLVKSAKNADNSRFSSFKTLNIKYKELILPKFSSLNSTDMRNAVKDGDKKLFYSFIPKKMSNCGKKKLWDRMRELC